MNQAEHDAWGHPDRAQIRSEVFRQVAALPHRYMDCSSNARAVLCDECQAVADRIRAIPWWGSR